MFDEINNSVSENFVVKCSYIEIYNEQIYDLLREEFEENQKLFIYEAVEQNEF